MSRCSNVFRTTVLLLAVLTLGLTTVAFGNVIVDFRQSANNETNGTIQGLGNVHWINSIVQSSNSRYYEGMSNFQRALFAQTPATTGNIHTLTLSHQFTKGGIHAYDFLTSWAQGIADDGAALGVPIQINQCGIEIGPPNTLVDSCNALHSAFFVDVDIPDDPYISKDGSTAAKIAAYEAIRGNRTVRIYGNAPISNASMTVSHDVANGADNGDSYAKYVLQWTSSSSQILVEMAGHLAISGDGTGMTWGPGLGSSQINGGPYHFKLDALGGALAANGTQTQVTSLGSQDNQIKGADILVPCPTCAVSGPTGPLCPGSAAQSYSVSITGTCTNQSAITWSLSNNTSGASFNGGNTGTSVSVNPGSSCGSFTLTSSFTCSNCIDPVTCSIDVTVQDNTAPVISGVGANTNIECPATPVFSNPTASDDCDQSPALTYNDVTTPGSCPQEYSVTRTWTATDDCGNSSTASQTINVQDNTAPVISGVGANANIECPATPVFSNPSAADACDPNPSLTYNDVTTPGSCPQEYSVTRTWTATDACGNSSQASQTITVEDNTPPTLSGQGADATIECPATPSFTPPTASDACDPNPVISFSDQTTPGACPQEYSVTRTWTVVDACGNQGTPVSQTITVEDNTAPVISGVGGNATIECPATPVFSTPSASDLCDPNPSLTFNDVTTPGSCPQEYSVTRTWTATDACGNSSQASQTITVEDNTAPVISGVGGPQTIECPATPVFSNPSASDLCDPSPSLTFNDVTTPGSCPQEYSVTRTWTATDACGNVSAPVSQTITVEDNTAPVISGVGGNQTIECPATPVFSTPSASDVCDPNPSLTFNDVTTPGSCPQEYSVTRTWTATDACGNSSQASQTITVEDNTAPVISGVGGNQTIECPATPVFSNPTASDLCDPNPSLTFNDVTTPGSCPQEYSVTRTWTATDACGNSSSASQTITVEDNTDPVLTACPAPIVVCEGSPISFTPPTATDACDSDVPVVCTRSDGQGLGDPYPIGTTTITCVAADDCGNSDDCNFTVTVNANPVCSISDGPGFGTPICAGSSTPIADLFCGPAGMASYSWSVDCGTISGFSTEQCVDWTPPAVGGTCTFTLTIVDGNGCTSTCTRQISVPNPTPCVLVPPATLPVCGSTGNSYCGPAGFADYQWSFSSPDWVITGGQGTSCITYTAGSSGPATLLLDATNQFGCHSSCDVPIDCQPGFEGCTPGFWKNHTGLWNQTSDAVSQCVASAIAGLGAPYSGNGTTGSSFRTTFGLTGSEMLEAGLNANLTLQQAINLGGGGFQKLARHAVAGLLSSCQVNYTYTTLQVLTQVHEAIINLEAEPLATQLAAANNLPHDHCESGLPAAAPVASGRDLLNVEDDNFALDPVAVEKAAGSALPTVFALRGSYPNPFNASTQINFALPQAGTVRLVIYNILGQPVRTLLDGDQPAGERSVLWNGTDNSGSSLSSGVYFYKIMFNGQVKVGRMNLIK
ncbi:MAG TPA: FlgD immunoglobulin-like domain containing protein [Verrucomicrobiae bacterium]|nr:FlgD immunoglobulin-like domain containing protein [Verrucomicrobiae bacterium]